MQGIARILYLPTLAGNCNCAHCGQQHTLLEPECDCDIIGQRILESHSFDQGILSISGGEPFLKKGFPDMLASLGNSGKWGIEITSNGICTEEIQRFCNAVNPIHREKISFSISIDGMPEVHNHIRQNVHAFERAAETLKFLQNLGIVVKVNTVIQRENMGNLEKFAQYMSREYAGVNISWISEILEINGREEFPYTEAETARIRPYIADDVGKVYLETFGAAKIRDCHAGMRTIVIAPSGKVYACLTGAFYKKGVSKDDFYIGDLTKQSLDEVFLCCQDENAPYRKAVHRCSGCLNPCEVSNEMSFWGLDLDQLRPDACKIDVEKIMEEIRARAAEEQERAQNTMFNREIDVAEIMRNIRHDVLDAWKPDALASGDADGINIQLRGIYNEIERINCYAVNIRAEAALKMEPGCTIPVAQSRPRLIQKLFTIIKRLVRKATRFLVLDQKEYNEKMNDCMRAMCESQEQVLKLTKLIMDQSSCQAAFQTQAQTELQSASGKILSLYGQLNSQRDFQIQAESVFRDTAKKLAELYQQLEEHVGNQREFQEQAEAEMQDMYHRIDELYRTQEGDQVISDDAYLQFENAYRGSEEEIRKRLQFYTGQYVEKVVRNKEQDVIIDLGCGRGEWLEYLRDLGYTACGVDMNVKMVDQCRSKGLQAEAGDAIKFLKGMDDNSAAVITAFQVAEHLSLNDLSELVREAYRVLAYHGILILETPNCQNVEVGAANFYEDPTHIRPLHPEYMQFLARISGYYETDIAYWKQAETEKWLDSVVAADDTHVLESPVVRTMLESMKNHFYMSPDFALIATK